MRIFVAIVGIVLLASAALSGVSGYSYLPNFNSCGAPFCFTVSISACQGSAAQCSNITQIQLLNPQQTFQAQANALFNFWIAEVIAVILAIVGLVVIVIGFVLSSAKPRSSLTTAAMTTITPNSIACPKCGLQQILGNDEKFCRSCGNQIR